MVFYLGRMSHPITQLHLEGYHPSKGRLIKYTGVQLRKQPVHRPSIMILIIIASPPTTPEKSSYYIFDPCPCWLLHITLSDGVSSFPLVSLDRADESVLFSVTQTRGKAPCWPISSSLPDITWPVPLQTRDLLAAGHEEVKCSDLPGIVVYP